MIGVVRGQTVRLNATNLGGPDTRPCEVALVFFDEQGDALIERSLSLIGGRSAFLDLNADKLSGLEPRSKKRFQIRALVNVLSDPDDKSQCEKAIVTTLEVFDNKTGQTSFVLNPALMMGVNPLPEPPSE